MRFLIALLVAYTIWPAAVVSERKLPTTVQADLVFPRNETYKPTPWFPIVLAFKGLRDVWPISMTLDMDIYSISESRLGVDSPSYRMLSVTYDEFSTAVIDPTFKTIPELVERSDGESDGSDSILPNTHYLYIPLVNVTNGTTDQFYVSFRLKVLRRCVANGTEIRYDWNSNPTDLWKYNLAFSSGPEGIVPDVEAAITTCPKPQPESSVAIRFHAASMTSLTSLYKAMDLSTRTFAQSLTRWTRMLVLSKR